MINKTEYLKVHVKQHKMHCSRKGNIAFLTAISIILLWGKVVANKQGHVRCITQILLSNLTPQNDTTSGSEGSLIETVLVRRYSNHWPAALTSLAQTDG